VACSTCGAGQFTPAKELECKECSLGKFQELAQATEYDCKHCTAGKEFTVPNSACSTCADGKFQDEFGTPVQVFQPQDLQWSKRLTTSTGGTEGTIHGYFDRKNKQLSTEVSTSHAGVVRIQLRFFSIDSWDGGVDGEKGKILVDDKEVWSKGRSHPKNCEGWSNASSDSGITDNGRWNNNGLQKCFFDVDINVDVGASGFKLEVGANLNSLRNDESWAFNKLRLSGVPSIPHCDFCPAGFSFSTISTACVPCAEGKYQEEVNVTHERCKFCQVGYEFTTTKAACAACDLGKFQAQNAASNVVCKFCAKGTEFKTTIVACDACVTGKYQAQDAAPSAACEFCGKGQYAVNATVVCKNCESGKFQELVQAAAHTCKFCVAGKAFDTNETACTDCVGGQYQEENGGDNVQCKTCAKALYAVASTAICKSCESGKFQEMTSAVEYNCKFCAVGKEFVDKESSCTTCSAGTYQAQNTAASASCADCPTGRYLTDAATTPAEHDDVNKCLYCLAGTEFTTKEYACDHCGVGQYQHENAVPGVLCAFCIAGKEFTSATVACTICLAGKYQSQDNVASVVCSDCPTGRYLTDAASAEGEHDAETDCLFCVKGKQFTSLTTVCANCVNGKYQDQDTNGVACLTCASGKAGE